ncbi:alpha/beta hydrolase [Streptococcus danieliae]|uniref:Alpha/beta hydrolase n=1 Tax=Streptococcus danieliae TaxID=747656 RepID=A0A7Z0LCZ9_9STRE|nr:alpha/beta hydrolase-fold protein [Streptococcus danieliae]MBF0717284.1 alpha/beta hydrolase [Streptococcus danieliae]MVX59581.1 alpha/beta hydrolase [Streptococcus danieliae]NYS49214.1 alpha/beta hydrolase [Streptococcus danieliae]
MIAYHQLDFPASGESRTIRVYLPDQYEHQTTAYPVMYFFDGHNLFSDQEATYGESWKLKDFLDQWTKDMIVVGLEPGHQGNQRLEEYSPYDIGNTFFAGPIQGQGRETLDWLLQQVKPFIDQTYRTYPDRLNTGIAGSSMGGLMTLYALSHYNTVFSKGAALSSALFGPIQQEVAQVPIDSNTRLYMGWGTREMGQNSEADVDPWSTSFAQSHLNLEASFQRSGAQTYLYPQIHGRHTESDWAQQVPLLMDFLWMR